MIYDSVGSTMVIIPCLVDSRGCLLRNLSMQIQQLTTTCSGILWTVWTHAMVDDGGIQFLVAIDWSRSYWHEPAVRNPAIWWLFTTLRKYSQPIASWSLLLLLPVWPTIFKSASWVTFLVAALAASRWTNCCLCSCVVPMSGVLDEAPIDRLDSDPLLPGWVVSTAKIRWCGIGEENHNEKSGMCWGIYS